MSGKVDAVRLAYYSFRVAGNMQPDIHIVGHRTYPAGTKKTVYVPANTPSVELFVNGASQGTSSKPINTCTFSFPNITWALGTIKAVGYNAATGRTQVCQHQYQLTTAGAATAIKLTPTAGPNGLQADGADVVMFDVEVVTANGNRRPDVARSTFMSLRHGNDTLSQSVVSVPCKTSSERARDLWPDLVLLQRRSGTARNLQCGVSWSVAFRILIR